MKKKPVGWVGQMQNYMQQTFNTPYGYGMTEGYGGANSNSGYGIISSYSGSNSNANE